MPGRCKGRLAFMIWSRPEIARYVENRMKMYYQNNLRGGMGHRANGAVFGGGGEIVRMEMKSLRGRGHNKQQETQQHQPAAGWRRWYEIGLL